ncbi:sensor histidine kinase [Duganella levis]|uniref:histidine kinase n=1 Tax=Duganella levis TaxID=2692169 RepID=A0ABW9VTA8_9BURK|nr:sensor histidine kinase [Duganella levis]MYN24852.1 GHKL domain-containing protein [Duganella levis]
MLMLRFCGAALLAALLMLLMCDQARAGNVDHDVAREEQLGLVLRYELLPDPSGSQGLTEVRNTGGWSYVSGRSPHFGFTKSAWWLRLGLSNSGAQSKEVVLDMRTALQDYVDWHVVDASGRVRQTVLSGDRRAFDFRYQRHYTLSLPLTLQAGERLTLYIRLASHDGVLESTALTLMMADQFFVQQSQRKLWMGMYLGALLAFWVCAFFLYCLTTEKIYLWFSLFLLLFTATSVVYHGVSAELMLRSYTAVNNALVLIFFALAAAVFYLFARRFLRLSGSAPGVLLKIYDVLICAVLASVPLVLLIGYSLAYMVSSTLILMNTMLLVVIGIKLCIRRNVDAMFFFIAFLPMGLALTFKLLSLYKACVCQMLLERNYYLAETSMFTVVALGFSIAHSVQSWRTAMRENELKVLHLGRITLAGEMTGTLTHELAQPLNSILNNSQAAERMIKDRRFDPARHLEIMLDITHQAKVATSIITHVRRLLLPGERTVERVAVCEKFQTVHKLLRHDLKRRQIRLRQECEAGLQVRGDPVQLQQVIVNLVMNATDAVKDLPEERRNITLAARSVGGSHALLSVSDTGCGFPTDCQDEIFSAFFTTKEGGMGLGLNICRKIVAAHGGEITAKSNQACGATVEFTLPLDHYV